MPHDDAPDRRLRRWRRTAALRDLAADVRVHPSDLIQPLFVGEMDRPEAVESMPGVKQWPADAAVEEIARLRNRGLRTFLLFGVTPTEKKDAEGRYAVAPEAPVNRVLRGVREAGLDVVLIADACFCEYTDHGHCGVIGRSEEPGEPVSGGSAGGQFAEKRTSTVHVDNDATLANLAELAVAQAEAGADVIAPSGMMDGQVAAIRKGLDAAGHGEVAILSYSVKYASSFYGPFRDAGGGGMAFGDRRGYQMDFRRGREWRGELQQDLAEGADAVMVKPAVAYLDVVAGVRDACDVPVAAYHVSGEYAMLHAAAERGWIDLPAAAVEVTTSIKRAGADWIVTYFAEALLDWL
ncbi:MAG: porphobilinogen synthase [Phycisphaeraceae bacterium]